MAKNQIKWQKGDWDLLYKYIADETDCPSGVVIDHLYFEDLRKVLWLLEHIHAGYYDDSDVEWGTTGCKPPALSGHSLGDMYKYAGEWEVSTFVSVHGVERWVLWRNKFDLTYGDCNEDMEPAFLPPPSNIHPQNNVWVLENANWQLAPSMNYYYDWDVNFNGKAHFTDYVNQAGLNLVNERYLKPDLFYPKQTDPKEQFQPIIYVDRNQKDYQYRSKVPLTAEYVTVPEWLGAKLPIWPRMAVKYIGGFADSIQRRDPWGILKDVNIKSFPGNQYCNYFGDAEANTNIPVPTEENAEWSYNPKINTGLQNKIEVVLCDDKLRLQASSTYKANCRRLMFMDYNASTEYGMNSMVYNPADTLVYRSIAIHNTGHLGDAGWWVVASEDEMASWEDYPNVNDECWGENESGFELFLKNRGYYDWYFENTPSLQYCPMNLAEIAKEHSEDLIGAGGDPPSLDELKSQWDLLHEGNWRRTWHNSLGRVKRFMRSFEMGEPTHRVDSWNPMDTPWPYPKTIGSITYTEHDKWFNSRTNSVPVLSDFDNKFATITKTGKYSFSLSGDYTVTPVPWSAGFTYAAEEEVLFSDGLKYTSLQGGNVNHSPTSNPYWWVLSKKNLKPGWMIHLCMSSSDEVKLEYTDVESESIKSVYVLKIDYDNELNVSNVMVNLTVGNFVQIGWNPQISNRHDPVSVQWSYSDDSFDISLGYAPTAELLVEMKELLDLCMYKGVSASIEVKQGIFSSSSQTADMSDSAAAAAFSSAKAGAIAGFTYDTDDEEWNYEDMGDEKDVRVDAWTGTPVYPPDVRIYTYRYMPQAFSVTFPNALTGLPNTVGIRFERQDWPDDLWPINNAQYSGSMHNNFLPEAECTSHYKYAMAKANGQWYFLLPENEKIASYYFPIPDQFAGAARLGLVAVTLYGGEVFIPLDWENVPDSVWDRDFLDHIDAPRTLIADNEAPWPNPPVFQYNPYGEFVLIPETETEEAYFELWVRAVSVKCEDYEGSNPVKYRLLCAENENLISEWSESRTASILVRTIPVPDRFYLDETSTENPSGTVTRIYCNSANFGIGDVVEVIGSNANNGIWTVVGASPYGYFDIDKGWYSVESLPEDSYVINYTALYTENSWALEAISEYTFALQAKDAAADVQGVPDNLTKVSRYEEVLTPTEFPADIMADTG